jgi:hypothetical protein
VTRPGEADTRVIIRSISRDLIVLPRSASEGARETTGGVGGWLAPSVPRLRVFCCYGRKASHEPQLLVKITNRE